MGQLADMPPQVLLAIIVAAEPAYEDVLDALFTFHDRAPADAEPFQLADEARERLAALVPRSHCKSSTDDTRPIVPSSTFPTSAGHKIWICPHQQLAPHSPVAK